MMILKLVFMSVSSTAMVTGDGPVLALYPPLLRVLAKATLTGSRKLSLQ